MYELVWFVFFVLLLEIDLMKVVFGIFCGFGDGDWEVFFEIVVYLVCEME